LNYQANPIPGKSVSVGAYLTFSVTNIGDTTPASGVTVIVTFEEI